MKYLITGGLGYLGIELAYHLSQDDKNKIVIYDKAVYGVEYASYVLNRKNVSVVVGDIRDIDRLSPFVKESDTIIHLASLVGAPLVQKRPIEAHETNILGTEKVVDLIGDNQRLMYASTGSTYGKVDGICTESTPISPLSIYGVHKAKGEELVSKKNALSMRFATVYGLSFRTRNDLYINNMIKKALVDRSVVLYEQFARRTFIHIHDIVRAVEYFSMDDNFESGPLNIGDPSLALTKL
ncbi:uncharacterized protein METZ01_LOCUS413165, partial [marine metagenome]